MVEASVRCLDCLLNGLLLVVVPLDAVCALQYEASGSGNAVYRYSAGSLTNSFGSHECAGISALLLGGGGCEDCRDADEENRGLCEVHDGRFVLVEEMG